MKVNIINKIKSLCNANKITFDLALAECAVELTSISERFVNLANKYGKTKNAPDVVALTVIAVHTATGKHALHLDYCEEAAQAGIDFESFKQGWKEGMAVLKADGATVTQKDIGSKQSWNNTYKLRWLDGKKKQSSLTDQQRVDALVGKLGKAKVTEMVRKSKATKKVKKSK
jgi:hypothetical protein